MDVTIIDQLLILLVDEPRTVTREIRALGHTEEEISAAWREARRLGFVQSTGLGMDRLTSAGQARAVEVSTARPGNTGSW
jgi:hypothetical protein